MRTYASHAASSHPAQLWLPDLAPRPERHNLFLALPPPDTLRPTLAHLARQLRITHDLGGIPVRDAHFHLSLHSQGEHDDPRDDLVAAVRQVGARFSARPFTVTFDRIMRFAAADAVVLAESSRNEALHHFHAELAIALTRAGLGGHVKTTFTPHITLLYSTQHVPEHAIAPVSWTANGFRLIDSLIGRRQHQIRGEWSFRD